MTRQQTLERAQNVKAGDKVRVHGFDGIVKDVRKTNVDGRNGTYIKVNFEHPEIIGFQYEGGWYGAYDEFLDSSFAVLDAQEA